MFVIVLGASQKNQINQIATISPITPELEKLSSKPIRLLLTFEENIKPAPIDIANKALSKLLIFLIIGLS